MLVLDTSYSMAALDFSPNRMEAAKTAAADFVMKRKNDRIGLQVVIFRRFYKTNSYMSSCLEKQ